MIIKMKKVLSMYVLLSIIGLSNALSQIPTNGLLGYWPFIGNANDLSGNSHNGTVYGAVLTSDRFGDSNSAYSFNGVDNFIDLGLFEGYSSHTFTGWFKISGQQNLYGTLVSKLYNDTHIFTNSEITVCQNYGTGYVINTQLGTGSAWVGYPINSAPFDSISWHHFVYSYNDSEKCVRTFLDNIMIDSILITSASGYNDLETIPIYLGARPNYQGSTAFFFNGLMDDIRIYNRALNQTEITSLFNEKICYQTITVTDTLIINVNLTGLYPVSYANTIKIYPNPAMDHIYIDSDQNSFGYKLKIVNALSQTVFETIVNQTQYFVDLNTWTGNGIYFVHIIDTNNNTIDIKKIVLQ